MTRTATRPATLAKTPFGARAGAVAAALLITTSMLLGIDALARVEAEGPGLLALQAAPAAQDAGGPSRA